MGTSNLSELPDDLLICILSLLSKEDIYSCRCVNKRLKSVCDTANGVWFFACHRLWGTLTDIKKWGSGNVLFKDLYLVLKELEKLIGFWRGVRNGGDGPLIVYDWRSDCVVGFRVLAVREASYQVCKVPFVWLGVSRKGQRRVILDPEGFEGVKKDGLLCQGGFGSRAWDAFGEENDLIAVTLSFVGDQHIVLKELQDGENWPGINRCRSSRHTAKEKDKDYTYDGLLSGSAPDRFDSEMHRYFANKISQSGSSRRQKKEQRRKDKERGTSSWKRKIWQAEHFVKVVECFPTSARPLQGLWKGISDSMALDFILVSYDELGGILCRKVGGSPQNLSLFGSVFWTADAASFKRAPLTDNEEEIYRHRIHMRSIVSSETDDGYAYHEEEEVAQVLLINQRGLHSTSSEGRLWLYASGRFGLGFLHNSMIADFKLIGSTAQIIDLSNSMSKIQPGPR